MTSSDDVLPDVVWQFQRRLFPTLKFVILVADVVWIIGIVEFSIVLSVWRAVNIWFIPACGLAFDTWLFYGHGIERLRAWRDAHAIHSVHR
jgi:hypothetical protein